MVCGHGLDSAPPQALPQVLLLGLVPQGRRAHIPGSGGVVLVEIHALVQQQVLGTGLHIHGLAPLPGVVHLQQGLPVGEVDDDHRRVRCLGDPQQAAHRLSLQIGRSGAGMGGGGELSGGLLLGDHAVNDTGVLAVEAGDAPQPLQLLQCPVDVPVADHHGGIGEIHLERRDALGEHVRQLCPDGLVPVVDGHVEAVVAEGPAVCLLMPQVQSVVQGLALVGAGEVNDRGGAAPKGCPGAGIEVIRRGGVCHVQVKVGVGVDKTGEEEAAGHVHHLVRRLGTPAHPGDLLAVQQQVGPPLPGAGDDGPALEQCCHQKTSLVCLRRAWAPGGRSAGAPRPPLFFSVYHPSAGITRSRIEKVCASSTKKHGDFWWFFQGKTAVSPLSIFTRYGILYPSRGNPVSTKSRR